MADDRVMPVSLQGAAAGDRLSDLCPDLLDSIPWPDEWKERLMGLRIDVPHLSMAIPRLGGTIHEWDHLARDVPRRFQAYGARMVMECVELCNYYPEVLAEMLERGVRPPQKANN